MASMGSGNPFVDAATRQIQETSVGTLALLTTAVLLTVTYAVTKMISDATPGKRPPHIQSTIPFLGKAVDFGSDPMEFLLAAEQKYGPVFSFTMLGKKFTYLIGSKASALLFNSRNDHLNAELIYGKLTTPVFGKGVIYDVPHEVFLQQKKMMKGGFQIARYRLHVPMIEKETSDFFKTYNWGDSGEADVFDVLSQLVILSASCCLHGKEIRSAITPSIAKLFWDLDCGFSMAAWLLPSWVPLPSFKRRDEAHVKVKRLFTDAITKRRASGEVEEDMLQTLMEVTYKDGRSLTDDEIAGMLIALLLGGQHTSSTSSAWVLFWLAKHQDIQDRVYAEQKAVFGEQLMPLDYDGLKECDLLDRCLRESLRLRPPLLTIMRLTMSPQEVMGYTIAAGEQVCVSPPINMCLPSAWEDGMKFNPDRFLTMPKLEREDKFNYVPFGAGRHRCVGEAFAYVQIKVIVSMMIRMYRFKLTAHGFPPIDRKTLIQTPEDPVIAYERRE